MSTQQSFLVCDSSTLANFKSWGSAISAFFSTATWTQSTDTGQVNWSTISSVPGSNAYVYEVWQPNDGLTTFFVKIEYGNVGTAAQPSIRLTISTSTNGAGTATGFIIGPINTQNNGLTPNATTTYECDFSGAAGRIGAMLWRNGTGNMQQLFAIERSVNSSGAYTSSYVTLWTAGTCSSPGNFSQRSLLLAVGAAPSMAANGLTLVGGWTARVVRSSSPGVPSNNTNAAAFNGSIPFDTPAPVVGYFDYACTVVGAACYGDLAEGVTFTVTLYGSTRTYMPGKIGPFQNDITNVNQNNNVTCLRYD
jgi:hypothetical protein